MAGNAVKAGPSTRAPCPEVLAAIAHVSADVLHRRVADNEVDDLVRVVADGQCVSVLPSIGELSQERAHGLRLGPVADAEEHHRADHGEGGFNPARIVLSFRGGSNTGPSDEA